MDNFYDLNSDIFKLVDAYLLGSNYDQVDHHWRQPLYEKFRCLKPFADSFKAICIHSKPLRATRITPNEFSPIDLLFCILKRLNEFIQTQNRVQYFSVYTNKSLLVKKTLYLDVLMIVCISMTLALVVIYYPCQSSLSSFKDFLKFQLIQSRESLVSLQSTFSIVNIIRTEKSVHCREILTNRDFILCKFHFTIFFLLKLKKLPSREKRNQFI